MERTRSRGGTAAQTGRSGVLTPGGGHYDVFATTLVAARLTGAPGVAEAAEVGNRVVVTFADGGRVEIACRNLRDKGGKPMLGLPGKKKRRVAVVAFRGGASCVQSRVEGSLTKKEVLRRVAEWWDSYGTGLDDYDGIQVKVVADRPEGG